MTNGPITTGSAPAPLRPANVVKPVFAKDAAKVDKPAAKTSTAKYHGKK